MPDWLFSSPAHFEQLLECLPGVLIYVKDAQGRYVWVNQTLVERSGLKGADSVLGKTADELFFAFGPQTLSQDLEVMRSRHVLRDQLRLYRAPLGDRYWCLSSKIPVLGPAGRALGLIGLSRDLPKPSERHRSYRRVLRFLDYLDANLARRLSIASAAAKAAVSLDTLERLTMELFHLTPQQLLIKKRIDRACRLLEESDSSITDIAGDCGYADHSAFTRQFKIATLITPRQYRAHHRSLAERS